MTQVKKPKRKQSLISKGHSDWISEKKFPPTKEDPEESETMPDDGIKVGADHAFSMYPPPKKNKIFRSKWLDYISTVVDRKNFKEAHLAQLEILCDLFVEYDVHSKYIRENGYTYEAYGRQGKQIKIFPQVALLNSVKRDIILYSKTLGIILTKDGNMSGGKKAGDDDWEG